jgi:hypothetical protein
MLGTEQRDLWTAPAREAVAKCDPAWAGSQLVHDNSENRDSVERAVEGNDEPSNIQEAEVSAITGDRVRVLPGCAALRLLDW